jgi:hypothetical protein
MTNFSICLAQSGFVHWLAGNWSQVNTTTREYIALFGSVTVLAVLALVWAAFFRKRKRRHPLQHRAPNGWGMNPPNENPIIVVKSSRSHRKRRREHRPRNPTLAETGGMPPLRPENSPDTPP